MLLIEKELNKLADPKRAIIYSNFFKTGKGQYGEGDVFLGITVPEQRKLAKKYLDLELNEIKKLLSSKIHEYRLTALIILVEKYKKSQNKKELYNFYLKNTKYINNWDLVDVTSHLVIGHYLHDKDKNILYKLAKSKNLWERRIAIISTFYFIRKNDFKTTLEISEILIKDKHDLIHKAVGWMLREIGKKDQKLEEEFLKKHYQIMPRTMLRYAIEKFDNNKKKLYMQK